MTIVGLKGEGTRDFYELKAHKQNIEDIFVLGHTFL